MCICSLLIFKYEKKTVSSIGLHLFNYMTAFCIFNQSINQSESLGSQKLVDVKCSINAHRCVRKCIQGSNRNAFSRPKLTLF